MLQSDLRNRVARRLTLLPSTLRRAAASPQNSLLQSTLTSQASGLAEDLARMLETDHPKANDADAAALEACGG